MEKVESTYEQNEALALIVIKKRSLLQRHIVGSNESKVLQKHSTMNRCP
jgi:hypothetical protein